jgi:hypothetical protein
MTNQGITEHLRVVNGDKGDDLFNLIPLTGDMNRSGLPNGLEPITHLQIRAGDHVIVELRHAASSNQTGRGAARDDVVHTLNEAEYDAKPYTP